MKRDEHQLTLPGVESMNQKDADSYNDMMGTAVIPDEALKIDMGVAVSVEEKQALWPDEKRIDIIGSNGNDGAAYDRKEKLMAELAKQGRRLVEPKSGRAITFLARHSNHGSGDT